MTAVDVSCPKCQAKLRLDEPPAADELVECPKCGTQFSPAAPPPPARKELPADLRKRPADDGRPGKRKGKKGIKADAPAGGPKKRKVKQKKSNPYVLALMVAGALVILGCVGAMVWLVLGVNGKVPEMASYIPGDCNLVRGVNVGLISKYPGYKGEMEKQLNAGSPNLKSFMDEAAKAANADPETFTDYVVIGKKKGGGGGLVVVVRSRTGFDTKAVAANLGTPSDTNGIPTYRSGKGAFAGAAVLVPTNKMFVIVPSGSGQQQMLAAAAAGGPKNKANTFAGKMGDAGAKITTGAIWAVILTEGDLKNYAKDMADPIKTGLPTLSSALGSTKVFGLWTSFGAGGVRMGAGFECDSPDTASKVATDLRNGPMGKGDDSEPPNDFKKVFSQSSNKEFMSDFMGNMKYKSSGSAAYFETRMSQAKAQQMLTYFNKPEVGDGATTR
jgi:hypothetical protein